MLDLEALGVTLAIMLLTVMAIYVAKWIEGLYVRLFKSVH